MNNSLTVGGIYRYFKRGMNQIIAIGTLSGTSDKYVVYKSFEDNRIWIRHLEDFTSRVDRNEYPHSQEYKFEEIDY